MSGRFFANIHIPATFLLLISVERLKPLFIHIFTVLIIALSFATFPLPVIKDYYKTDRIFSPSGPIVFERDCYYWATSLYLTQKHGYGPSVFHWAQKGIELKEQNRSFYVTGNIGLTGVYAGPQVYILDFIALSNHFLTYFPHQHNSRVGHYIRYIPDGLIKSIISNENHLSDSQAFDLYNKIELITKGAIFDIKRMKLIVELNISNIFKKNNIKIDKANYYRKDYLFDELNAEYKPFPIIVAQNNYIEVYTDVPMGGKLLFKTSENSGYSIDFYSQDIHLDTHEVEGGQNEISLVIPNTLIGVDKIIISCSENQDSFQIYDVSLSE